MTSIKVKFRSSSVADKEGMLYFQVIHERVVKQFASGYNLYRDEWDNRTSQVRVLSPDENRRRYLSDIKRKLQRDIARLKCIVGGFERRDSLYTSDMVVSVFQNQNGENYLFGFMRDLIFRAGQLGKESSRENYETTLRSFMKFRRGEDLLLDEINSDLMVDYEVWLRQNGVSMNTSSFYMRNLRSVYNKAVEKKLVFQMNPFRHVYTGIDKTVKRAVSLKTIRQLCELDFSHNPKLEYVRDLFMFSFYTRGMAFVDMAYLRKSDLKQGILTYRRRKTGQLLCIRWEECMQKIIHKYEIKESIYLLPIIKDEEMERKQYKNASHLVNLRLKKIGEMLGLSIHLTMYVARHAWASIAKSKNIPISVISEGMGHDSEMTTRIYLASLDTAVIDKANNLIIKSVFKE